MQNRTFLVLLKPIFGERLKTAPPKEIGCWSCEVQVVIRPEKASEFRISVEKSVSISVKTFFFLFWRPPVFGRKKRFPRNFLSIFGQTVWFWFKNNENSGQGCLHFSHSFKKAPPLFQILATHLDSTVIKGGVLEDVLGLVDWYILKSLASKVKSLALTSRPQVLENWPVLGSRTAVFFELLKFCGALEKFFGKRFLVEIAWKIFVKTFFFFLKSTCACVLGPWPGPRAFLSLASSVSVLGKAVLGLGLGFFVSLALASSLVSSTPPLTVML